MARPSSAGSRISMIKWNANHVRSDKRKSDSNKSVRTVSRATSRASSERADLHEEAKGSNETSDTTDKLDSASIITFTAPAKVTLSIRRFKRVRWCSRVENIAPLRFSLPPSEVDVSQTPPGMAVYEVKLPTWWCRFWNAMCCVRTPQEEIYELPATPVPRKRPASPPIPSTSGSSPCDEAFESKPA